MTVGGNTLDLDTKLEQIGQIFFDFLVMFPIGKAKQLGISIKVILVTNQAKLRKIGGIYS